MILYHFSDALYSELLPSIGSKRHDAEDKRAIGKAVIWLTSSLTGAPGIKGETLFRYEVEVDENDPCLHKDEANESLRQGWKMMQPSRADAVQQMPIEYFYTKPLKVISVTEITN